MKTVRFVAVASMAVVVAAGSLFAASSKKSLRVTLFSEASLNGTVLTAGDYKISWTEGAPDTDVQISRDGKVVVAAHAKIEERPSVSNDDSLVTRKDSKGSMAVSEIRLRGRKAVLVLSAS